MQTSSPLLLPGENLLSKHLCCQEGLEDLWLMKPRGLWEVWATLLPPRPGFGRFLWPSVPAFPSPATPAPSFCVCFLQKEWDAIVQRRVGHLCSTGPSIAPSHARGRHRQSITAPLSPGRRPGHLRWRQPLPITQAPKLKCHFCPGMALLWGNGGRRGTALHHFPSR